VIAYERFVRALTENQYTRTRFAEYRITLHQWEGLFPRELLAR
jgi:hypothetical protein